MPSFTADFFGAKYMGGIYGWILLAWGAAAIPSPIMIARLHQQTGAFFAGGLHYRGSDGVFAGIAIHRQTSGPRCTGSAITGHD